MFEEEILGEIQEECGRITEISACRDEDSKWIAITQTETFNGGRYRDCVVIPIEKIGELKRLIERSQL